MIHSDREKEGYSGISTEQRILYYREKEGDSGISAEQRILSYLVSVVGNRNE